MYDESAARTTLARVTAGLALWAFAAFGVVLDGGAAQRVAPARVEAKAFGPAHQDTRAIPQFGPMDPRVVSNRLRALGFVPTEQAEYSAIARGAFTRTDPPAGSTAQAGSGVIVYYSDGAASNGPSTRDTNTYRPEAPIPPDPQGPPNTRDVVIPMYKPQPVARVVDDLRRRGFDVRESRTEPSATLTDGTFLRTAPPGGSVVRPGTGVTVTYAYLQPTGGQRGSITDVRRLPPLLQFLGGATIVLGALLVLRSVIPRPVPTPHPDVRVFARVVHGDCGLRLIRPAPPRVIVRFALAPGGGPYLQMLGKGSTT